MAIEDQDVEKETDVVETTSGSEGPISVNLAEVDDDDSPETEATPGRMTRRERRRQNSIETIKAEYEAKLAAQEKRLDALQAQFLANMSRGVPAASVEAEDNDPISRIESEQNLILTRLSTPGISKEEEASLIKKHRQLDRRRISEITRATQGVPAARVDRSEIEKVMLENEFPEVFSSPHARMAAQQELHMLMASGAPETIETARKAAKNIATRLKAAGGFSEVSDAQKAKYGGVSTRPGGSTGGNSNSVTLDPALMSIAREWAKNRSRGKQLSDKEIATMYVKDVMKPAGLL